MKYHIDMINQNPDSSIIGQRIRLLRRQHHLTQAALAAKVGIRTGPMNTLENGHHLPSLPVLCKLADVLHTDVNNLLAGEDVQSYIVRETGPAYGVREPERPFAAKAGDYSEFRARIIRFEPERQPLAGDCIRVLDQILNAFLALEDICGVQKRANVPLTLQLPRTEIGLARFVTRIRSLFGVSDAVIFDYLELFENAGLRVVFLVLPEKVESVSCYDRDCENAFFFIATGLSVERQLFRLCCELGRIYMYNGGLASKGMIGKLDAEHTARRFAALFLMPEEAVIATVRQVGIGPGQWTWDMLMRIKHRFGVSAEAFLYRLGELDLIKPALLTELKVAIRAHYAANANAEPDSTRRVLTPNGRLGDLLLCAEQRKAGTDELSRIRATLKTAGVKT